MTWGPRSTADGGPIFYEGRVIVLCRTLYYKTSLSSTDRRRLNRAINLAKIGACKKKHGAVLVAGGRVMSVGINTNRNDPAIIGDAQLNYSVHAEAAAIRALGHPVKNGIMYVARVDKRGNPKMSKPCIKCQELLRKYGVKKVVYTVDEEMVL